MHIVYLSPIDVIQLIEFFPSIKKSDYGFLQGIGGYAVTNLVRTRLEKQEKTTIITLSKKLKNKTITVKDNNNLLIVLPARLEHYTRDCYKLERALIVSELTKIHADLIHINWTYEYALAAVNVKTPKLLTVRDNTFSILKYSQLYYLPNFFISLYNIYRYKHISVVSPYIQKFIKKIKKNTYPIVPNPLPKDLFKEKMILKKEYSNKNTITVVGVASKLKNPKSSIISFAIIKKDFPDAVLNLCGPGFELGNKTHKWAKANNFLDGVNFLGAKSHQETLKLIEESKIYLHTSKNESFGNSIAEAMLLGTPVIAGKNSGAIPWLLNQGSAGILVDVNDPKQISIAINKCFSDKMFYEKIRNGAHGRILNLSNPEIIYQKYNAIYQNIIQNTRENSTHKRKVKTSY